MCMPQHKENWANKKLIKWPCGNFKNVMLSIGNVFLNDLLYGSYFKLYFAIGSDRHKMFWTKRLTTSFRWKPAGIEKRAPHTHMVPKLIFTDESSFRCNSSLTKMKRRCHLRLGSQRRMAKLPDISKKTKCKLASSELPTPEKSRWVEITLFVLDVHT